MSEGKYKYLILKYMNNTTDSNNQHMGETQGRPYFGFQET